MDILGRRYLRVGTTHMMGMRIFLCLAFAFGIKSALAQEKPPILSATKHQKGIYRNFQEFVNNAPSIRTPF
jgi:hypothetical protein